MKKIIVIAGPTAVGKTELSIALAKALNTEIISADSVQVYKKLDIGSAKPTQEEMAGIPHHLIDVADPFAPYSVSEYVAATKAEIHRLHDLEKTPVIVGGTGLYINGLVYDMGFGESAADADYRALLVSEAQSFGGEVLYEKLKACDSVAAERIHPNNIKRVIRALEINHITGKPMADFAQDPVPTEDYEVVLFGLSRDRKVLYDRIDRRVHMMFEQGLLEEVKSLKNLGLNDSYQSMQGIGYKEVLVYLDGKTTYDAMVDDIQKGSRHYAKRQFTWFKRYPFIHWLDLDTLTVAQAVETILGSL